jgi:hypothetical protein
VVEAVGLGVEGQDLLSEQILRQRVEIGAALDQFKSPLTPLSHSHHIQTRAGRTVRFLGGFC